MPLTEWTVGESPREPNPKCESEGKHTYRISIEEGQLALTPVEPCGDPYCWLPEPEEIECSSIEGVFKFKVHRECWDENGKTSHGTCDCNFWVELVPVDPT